jgi:hypothetical protein
MNERIENSSQLREAGGVTSDLVSSVLLDCHGKITHRLTVTPDGRVRIDTAGLAIVVDPTTRSVLSPRGANVADPVMSCAVALMAELRPERPS